VQSVVYFGYWEWNRSDRSDGASNGGLWRLVWPMNPGLMAGTCWFRKSSRTLQMVQHVTFLFCTSNNKVWYISLILAACFDRCTITATAIIATLAQWALLLVQCLSKTSRFPNVLWSREPHDTSINCCASVLAKREQDNVIIVASSDKILMGTRSTCHLVRFYCRIIIIHLMQSWHSEALRLQVKLQVVGSL